jgi:hypothetical protein
MRTIVVAVALSLLTTSAFAQMTCKQDTEAKKLHGAAATSHMKKCQADAKSKCEADSKARNLHGAAATSHTKKCIADAVGS